MKKKIINLLIKFILPYTDYDKLKEENKEQKKDIYILVEKKEDIDYWATRIKWQMNYKLESAIWMGDPNPQKLEGLLKQIT